MSEPATPLPTSYRWALVAAVVVGFQVALAAGFDVQSALEHDEQPPMTGSESAVPGFGLSPLAQRQVVLAGASGYQSAIEAMLYWRIGTSVLLAIAAGLVFICAMRLRVSEDDRPAIAQQLGIAALIAAVTRSIDGAEHLVIVRSMLEEMGKVFVREGVQDAATVATVFTFVGSAISVGWTLAVVAGFVTLGNYFRSEALRTALGRAEP